jgi:hypothetical protein
MPARAMAKTSDRHFISDVSSRFLEKCAVAGVAVNRR